MALRKYSPRLRLGSKLNFIDSSQGNVFENANNIVFISDLLDENVFYLNIQDLQNKYSVETNFLTFKGLQKSIKAFMKSLKIIKEKENFKPFVQFNLKLFCTAKKGTKTIYKT